MVQPEKRLLWHPRQENKFVVGGGSQITLYEWAPESPEIRQVTSHHDLHHLKCFAWSPDPAFDDLIAVGETTGKIDLIRIEASKHARRDNILSGGPSVSLPVRNSRACNALAFCTADPNYLAAGLDKVRGDCSLMIWDVSTASPALSISPGPIASDDVGKSTLPLRRPQPQIPRADGGPRADNRVLQQHAPTELVSSLAFLPQSTHLLLAGISHRWLRLFDFRSQVPTTNNVASKVQGIATDPFDPHRVACFGDGTVAVWDSRRLSTPLLTFTEKDASADGARLRPGSVYAGVEFSSSRRGTLASLERDASYVRFWDLMGGQAHAVEDTSSDEKKAKDVARAGRRSWANLPWPSGSSVHVQAQQAPKEPEIHASLILSDTCRTKSFARPLASFALAPSPHPHPLTSNVMVVNREGDLELYAVHDTPKQAAWSARGDLSIGAGRTFRMLEGFHDDPFPSAPDMWDAPDQPAPQYSYNAITGASHSRAWDESPSKADSGPVIPPPPPPPASFGRGDEEGFPALSAGTGTAGPANLAATKPQKGRTHSPSSSARNYSRRMKSADSAMDRESVTKSTIGHRSSSRGTEVGWDRSKERSSTLENRAGGRVQAGALSQTQSVNRGRRPFVVRRVNHVVEDDISMVMRRRALQGYGLSKLQNNIFVTQNDDNPSRGTTQMLSDLWEWIYHSHDFLCIPTPKLHGYDFSYQGLMGIWDGFQPLPITQQTEPTPPNPYADLPADNHRRRRSSRRNRPPGNSLRENFQAALAVLASRRATGRPWKPTVSTGKTLQRQIALHLCGWSLREEELMSAIKSWEREGKYSRAACWLVFTKQYAKAVDLLMRSDDEAHRMMSGTIAALIPQGSSPLSSKSLELREHCERLIVRLQDPYFRALLTHLALNDWSEVLEEEALPFRERLAIAFLFLDDKAVTSYLRRSMDHASTRGDIDGLMVPGLASTAGIDILQSYVDRTGDVQSAAILGSYVCPPRKAGLQERKRVEEKVGRWVESYRDLLDGFKMFHCRVGFDIERGQVMLSEGDETVGSGEIGDWVPRQILIRCNYCNKPVSSPEGPGGGEAVVGGPQQTGRPTTCPHCNRSLPRCSICLMTLEIIQDAVREAELLHSQPKDTINDAIVMCQTCRHGGHASHILGWFYGADGARPHVVCAVADCDCRCADEM